MKLTNTYIKFCWLIIVVVSYSFTTDYKKSNKTLNHDNIVVKYNDIITTSDACNITFSSAMLIGQVKNIASSKSPKYRYGIIYIDKKQLIDSEFDNYIIKAVKNEQSFGKYLKYATHISNDKYVIKFDQLNPNTEFEYCALLLLNDTTIYKGELMSFATSKIEISKEQKVDLGLSVKWAGYNIGAKSPEEFGDYFGWGDITGMVKSTKYSDYSFVESKKEEYNPEYDIATSMWGSEWRMPSLDEVKELLDKCTWTWIKYGNVNGYAVTGPNGNTLFLPAAGCRYGNTICVMGERGSYWIGDICNSYKAYYLYFNNKYHGYNYFLCYGGRSVRAVVK